MIESTRIFETMSAELMTVHDGKVDPNIHEFGHAIWGTIKDSCMSEKQELARYVLGLRSETVQAITDASSEQLDRLCLRTALSFKFDLNETKLIEQLNARNDNESSRILIEHEQRTEIAETYLHLIQQAAAKDFVEAALAFGFTTRLTLAMSRASFKRIRQVARTSEALFKLRFNEGLIPKLLSEECPVLYTTMLYQQVFSSSVSKI